MMDKQKQFVRMMDQAIGLLRQAAVAGSLAPSRVLSDGMSDLIDGAVRLRDDGSVWFFGQDSRGRMMTESGQFIGDDDE